DLIESRSTSHRKGQPSTTTYSYSASFAVLLSGRPVQGAGRIWADGNLLRGAAGDFKVATGFRLHLGGEDQAADPLIASIEGADAAPAHRGCAYAVFENMPLGDFGNRIPSLTFELIADAGAAHVGSIAAEIAGGAIADGGTAAALDGFSAYGGSARAVAEMLASASGARFVADGGALAMTDADGPVTAVADGGYAASRGTAARRTIAPIERSPKTLSLAYYDPARDYQTGVQRARRPGAGSRDDRIDLPAALAAGAAKALAETWVARADIEREQRIVALPADAAGIAPGSLVAIGGEDGRWRVAEAALENMVTTLTCVRATPPVTIASASPGRASPAPDRVAGTTILRVAELPAPGDSPLAAPRLSVMANGTGAGWRRASLLYSLDGGASWRDGGETAAPATIGALASAPGAAWSALADLANSFEVDLARADMALNDADGAALDRGGNLALAGDELLQFGRAEQIGPTRWRLSHLWRGRRGTEAAAGTQAAGDRFVLLAPEAVAAIDLPVAAIGSTVRVLASGIGDTGGPVEADCLTEGKSVRPPSPAQLRLNNVAGALTLAWTRRSRAGFRWIDGGDVPIAEESEAYRVTIAPPTGTSRTIVTADRACPLDPGEMVSGAVIAVRQIGVLAESPPASLEIS
ncbi:MAG: phage tail protein, partial [Proteobacteria bacterium]|nr:phage tail protein [Pseudomonadota bacterium]